MYNIASTLSSVVLDQGGCAFATEFFHLATWQFTILIIVTINTERHFSICVHNALNTQLHLFLTMPFTKYIGMQSEVDSSRLDQSLKKTATLVVHTNPQDIQGKNGLPGNGETSCMREDGGNLVHQNPGFYIKERSFFCWKNSQIWQDKSLPQSQQVKWK